MAPTDLETRGYAIVLAAWKVPCYLFVWTAFVRLWCINPVRHRNHLWWMVVDAYCPMTDNRPEFEGNIDRPRIFPGFSFSWRADRLVVPVFDKWKPVIVIFVSASRIDTRQRLVTDRPSSWSWAVGRMRKPLDSPFFFRNLLVDMQMKRISFPGFL